MKDPVFEVGETVVLSLSPGSRLVVGVVKRTVKRGKNTNLVVEHNGHESEFRPSGTQAGSHGYTWAVLCKATPDRLAGAQQQALIAKLKAQAWEKLPLYALNAVAEIVDSIPKTTEFKA